MQVNQPDKGIFKGIGLLERALRNTKKNFPQVRNKHQFAYTHNHGNHYESSSNYFYRSKFTAAKRSASDRYFPQSFSKQEIPSKKKIANMSQIVFGQDRNDFKSFSQAEFKKYEGSHPPKPFYTKQEGIGLGQDVLSDLYKTTNKQHFAGVRMGSSSKNQVKHRNWRGAIKHNPITGQSKDINSSFGFEDFKYNGETERKYRANNFTRYPAKGERFDIITGRRL